MKDKRAEEDFLGLIGKEIKQIFLIVFPPVDEDDLSQIDTRIGLVFRSDRTSLQVIAADKDMWTPYLIHEEIPQSCFPWTEYPARMGAWMNSKNFDVIDFEYYDVTDIEMFDFATNKKIESIEFAYVEQIGEPCGVKLNFDKNSILVAAIGDGTTVTTNKFNKDDIFGAFKRLGKVIFRRMD